MRLGKLLVSLLPVFSLANGAFAQNNAIPAVPQNAPYFAYDHGTGVDGEYNAASHVFSVLGLPTSFFFPARTPFCNANVNPSCPAAALSVTIQVDNNGNLIGGNPAPGQPDFELIGQIANGGNTYASPLLTGTVTQFYYDGVNDTSNFSFRFAVTGGSLASLYLNPPSMNNDLWMALNVETVAGTTDFTGSFA